MLKRILKIGLITTVAQLSMASVAQAVPPLSFRHTEIEVADLQECQDKSRRILREEGLDRTDKHGDVSDFVAGFNDTYNVIIDCYYSGEQIKALIMVTGNTSLSETDRLLDDLTITINEIR